VLLGTDSKLGQWTVTAGDVVWVGSAWAAAAGDGSVDLSGTRAGTLAITLPTIAGEGYTLRFALAGNPYDWMTYWGDPDAGRRFKDLALSVGDIDRTFVFDTAWRSRSSMGWTSVDVPFTAAADGRLEFHSLENAALGPAIDEVTVYAGGTRAVMLGAVEAGTLVEYSTDDGGTWTTSFTPVEGSNKLRVRQTDAAGNVSPEVTLEFTIDTVAPDAPGVALVADTGSSDSDGITSDGRIALTGVEPGATVRSSSDSGATWRDWSAEPFVAATGNNTLLFRQVDLAGNPSPVRTFSFTLDNHRPASPAVGLVADSGSSATDRLTNDPRLLVSDIETGAAVEYSTDSGDTWLGSFTPVEDENRVRIRQRDVAGNVSEATEFVFRLDTVAPDSPGAILASDTGISATDGVTSDGTIQLSGLEAGAIAEYSTDGGATWQGSFTAAEGTNALRIRQRDAAGNASPARVLLFTLDRTPPRPTAGRPRE
jgi:hypothetical protein